MLSIGILEYIHNSKYQNPRNKAQALAIYVASYYNYKMHLENGLTVA